MTAPFAASLCGFRSSGNPSTSDAHDAGSIAWGKALFEELRIPLSQEEVNNVGSRLEQAIHLDLSAARPDLLVQRSRQSSQFAQYQHLSTLKNFQAAYSGPDDALSQALDILSEMPVSRERTSLTRILKTAQKRMMKDHNEVLRLRGAMAQESILNLDIAVSQNGIVPRLLLAVSCKWSLRTDRAQDCNAQGLKLASHRRGHMPHFSVLTIEPRPAMLRLLAYGSGTIDCVYHIALPALRRAALRLVDSASSRSRRNAIEQQESLDLMIAQHRIRDYSQLVAEVHALPAAEGS